MDELNLLLAQMDDLSVKADKIGVSASRFLTPSETQSVADHFKYKHVDVSFDGGFGDAERTRAVFVNADWGVCVRDELFTALDVSFRPQDTLSHRDILGAIMALGIERDTVGDIVCEDNRAALVCLPELGGYIAENLTKAGRVGVAVTEITLSTLPMQSEELIIKTDTVASLRLDVMLCAAFGVSRTKAASLISSGLVSLDHRQCVQPTKDVPEGSLLSVRGLGRAKVLEVGGMSRKGRIFVQFGVYGR